MDKHPKVIYDKNKEKKKGHFYGFLKPPLKSSTLDFLLDHGLDWGTK